MTLKATAAAPTLAEGSNSNETSCDLSGNQRVVDSTLAGLLGGGFDVVVAPAVTPGAYQAGDVQGGLLSFDLSAYGIAADRAVQIMGVQVAYKSAVQPDIRVVFIQADLSAPLADNAAYTLATVADVFKVRKTVSSTELGSVWKSHGTPKTLSMSPPPFIMKPYAGTSIIKCYLVDDTGVTLGSTSDLQVRISGMPV